MNWPLRDSLAISRPTFPAAPFSEEEVIRFAAGVEQNREHPWAHKIVQGANDQGISLPTVVDFDSVTGGGVHGAVESKSLFIGQQSLLADRTLQNLTVLDNRADELQLQGRMMFAVVDGLFAGIVAVSDPIKDSTRKDIFAPS